MLNEKVAVVGTDKEVHFKSNFEHATICGCKFEEYMYRTSDVDAITRLRNHQPCGDGVMVEEVDPKKVKKAETEKDIVGELLKGIVACKTVKDLESAISDIEKKHPDGDGLTLVAQSKIKQVCEAQMNALEDAEKKTEAAKQSEKAIAERGAKDKKEAEAEDKKKAEATKKTAKKGK